MTFSWTSTPVGWTIVALFAVAYALVVAEERLDLRKSKPVLFAAGLLMASVVLAVARENRRFVAVACVNLVVAANAGGAWCAFGDITTLMVWQAHRAEFFDFFTLFVPSLVNFVVPALLMHPFVPKGRPPPGTD